MAGPGSTPARGLRAASAIWWWTPWGLLLAVTVTAASVQDRDAAAPVVALACAKVPGLRKLYADGAYAGKCAVAIEETHGITWRSFATR